MDTHLGAQLKRAREASGLSLKEIAARTKISVTALEAVERNDFTRLPGGIFGRSFVRAYALEVGLDPDAVVVSFVDALEQDARDAAARQAIRPEITADDRRFLERQRRAMLWLRIGVALFVIAAVAVVAWQLRSMRQDTPAGEAGASASSSAPAGQPSGFAPPPSAPLDAPASARDPAESLAPSTAEEAASPAAGPAAPPAGDAPAPDAAGAAGTPAPADAATPIVFDLAISGDCWISYSVDGGAPVAQLFRAGDRRRIEATRELVLDVGNAGALALRIDGRQARPLGDSGAHVRRRITRDTIATLVQ